MANTFLTNSDIAEHLLAHFINACQFVRLANRYYQDEFRSVNGFERGNTINILRPTYFVPRQGPTMSLQDVQERQYQLTLQYQDGQDIAITSQQLTTSIDDLSQRVLRPIAIGLANLVDIRAAITMGQTVYNTIGTGTTPINSFSTFNTWKNQLFKRGVIGDYEAILNPEDATDLQNSLQNAFNMTLNEEISIYGRIGELSNVGVYSGQNVQPHLNGNWAGGAGPAVNGPNQTGSVLAVKGFAAGAVVNTGDTFYISTGANTVYATNPVPNGLVSGAIGNTTNDLQRFTLTQPTTMDGGGNGNLNISPPITITGPYQTVTATPSDSAVLTLIGTSGAAYRSNFMFTKEALTIAMVPLVTPPGAVNAVVMTDPDTGVSMRVIDAYDVVLDRAIKRADILYGIACFPEYAIEYAAGG